MDSEHVLDLASRSRVIVRVQAGDGLAKRYVLQRGQINRAGSRYCLVDISVSCEPFDELVQGDIDVRECAAIQRRLVFVNPRLDQCGSFALCSVLFGLRYFHTNGDGWDTFASNQARTDLSQPGNKTRIAATREQRARRSW